MASEATVTVNLRVEKDNLSYSSQPTSYQMDVSGNRGYGPGGFSVPIGGVAVDLSAFSQPGFCWMQNLDPTNEVHWGIYDPTTNKFYVIGKLPPGKKPTLIYFSDDLLERYEGTGTATTGQTMQFFMKAKVASCVVQVNAFEA